VREGGREGGVSLLRFQRRRVSMECRKEGREGGREGGSLNVLGPSSSSFPPSLLLLLLPPPHRLVLVLPPVTHDRRLWRPFPPLVPVLVLPSRKTHTRRQNYGWGRREGAREKVMKIL